MNYQKILKFDLNNGPGVRETIWVSGCNNNCPNCFNKEAQDPNSGIPFTEESMDELIEGLRPDYVTGLTLLGGDPLYISNIIPIRDICKKIKEVFGNTKTIWLWTGYLWENIKSLDVVNYVDVIVDGPFIEKLKDTELLYSGSSNQRVIDVSETLKSNYLVTLKNKRE